MTKSLLFLLTPLLLGGCQGSAAPSAEACLEHFGRALQPIRLDKGVDLHLDNAARDGRVALTYVFAIEEGEGVGQFIRGTAGGDFDNRLIFSTGAGDRPLQIVEFPGVELADADVDLERTCRSLPEGVELVGFSVDAGSLKHRIGQVPDA